MDASPDVQEISRNITNRSISEPASPTPPTKSNPARRENLNVKSGISIKSSSDKDAAIDQLKERVIALARTSLFKSQDSSGFSLLFFTLLGIANIKLSPTQLAWKTLIKKFAERGFVLWNYPEGVPFPCDDAKSKGIQGLPVKEQAILLEAFSHPTHPITLKHAYESGRA